MPNDLKIAIVRSLRKTISMHVRSDGVLEVKAPKLMPMLFINQFITSHMDWVEKQREKVQSRPVAVKRQYVHGEEFFYLGKPYKLDIGMYSQIGIVGNKLQFPAGLTFRLQKELTDWYIREAKKVITDRLEKNANEMQVSYTDMYVSDTSSKWGSCSHDNRLQFNWRLIMAPMLVLNYVIVHELSHTVHKNHSRSFWNKVRSVNPSYRQQIKWLKDNGHTLIV